MKSVTKNTNAYMKTCLKVNMHFVGGP